MRETEMPAAREEGKTKKEIIRCLKRYIAREVYKTLCRPTPPGGTSAPQLKQDLQFRPDVGASFRRSSGGQAKARCASPEGLAAAMAGRWPDSESVLA